MTENSTKINQLLYALPEGLLADAAWLRERGYETSSLSKYVALKLLEHPARAVYRKPRGNLSWEQAVISLQTLLYRTPLAVGGRTALDLQGYSHYLSRELKEVHLYGPSAPPNWLKKLELRTKFVFHKSTRVFLPEPGMPPKADLESATSKQFEKMLLDAGFTMQQWAQWNWPLVMSTPERALLELLDEVPARETFEQASKLVESLSNLRPRRMQLLLERCHNVKVKRLFFFFSDQNKHAWAEQLDKSRIDLGKGKRMLVKGGALDRKYQITIPKDFNANP